MVTTSNGRAAGALAVALTALLTACSEDEPGGGEAATEYFYDCDNAPAGVRVFATDESYRAIVDKEAAGLGPPNDLEAATLMAPASGSALSASAPPTFVLRTPTTALLPPARGPAPPPCPPRGWRRWLDRLSPVGVAHAHCPGVSGDNFLLRLLRPGQSAPVYSALLSVTSFTPGAAAWQKALAPHKGQTLTLTLLRAGLSGGRVDIGPFTSSQTVTFSVGD